MRRNLFRGGAVEGVGAEAVDCLSGKGDNLTTADEVDWEGEEIYGIRSICFVNIDSTKTKLENE